MMTAASVPMSQSWHAWLSRAASRTARWSVFELVDRLAARPLHPQGAWRWPEQAVRRSRDERRRRRLSAAASLGTHVVLLLLWSWWNWLHVAAPVASSAAPPGDAELRVEYIGIGTPEQAGGGEPDAGAAASHSPVAPATTSTSAPETPTASATPPATASDQPEPVEAAQQPVPAPQPLVVTQVEQADTDFVVPRTRTVTMERRPQIPAMSAQADVPVNPRDVPLDTTPTPPAVVIRSLTASMRTPVADVAATPSTTAVRQREVILENAPTPPSVRMPTLPSRPIPAASANTASATVRSRDVPLARAPASVSPTASGSASASTAPAPDPSIAAGQGRPAPSAQGNTGVSPPGAGPKPQATTGGWPDPNRGDDWGAGMRNRPGGQGTQPRGSGLHDADGRPNLPPGTAAAGGGLPPGTDDWTRAQIDGNGTWLKRPPLDYRVSPFEQYWRPHETLLQEWVRRGVKQMHIPIPGTGKRITCVVSMLQLGGGCGITDPNVNDQEAVARPPPDIPFKPDLQDDPATLTDPPAIP